jgi:hypothetical protein
VAVEAGACESSPDNVSDRTVDLEASSTPGTRRTALRRVVDPLWASRLVVLIGGVIGLSKAQRQVPLTTLGSFVVTPLDHWDSAWYLRIASTGYRNVQARAFFPLYPMLVHLVGIVTGDPYAGVIISTVAFFVALFLLYRLVEVDFSSQVAAMTVALVAFCPFAFFFFAIYTESLFLVLTVGAVYAARRERWLVAGILGAFASATRNSGVLVAIPILLLYLYGPRGDAQAPRTRWHDAREGLRILLPRYRLALRIWPVLLVPVGMVAFTVYLVLTYHAGIGWLSSEKYWHHTTVDPIEGFARGASAGWSGIRDLLSHPASPFTNVDATLSFINVLNLVACLAGLLTLVVCVRTLPIAYSGYAAAAFVLPLTSPVPLYPLVSLPRYELVIFPLFIGVARALAVRRWTAVATLTGGAVLLGVFAAMIALGDFVA